jgi:ABC-type branched-subunit amino acid transport system substrate-binding protein
MKKKITIILTYIIFFFNFNLFCSEKNIKIGLLAPFTGEFDEIGNSMLFATQLALDEIDDKNVLIIPRDSGINEKEKLHNSIKEIKDQGAKLIIGPITNEEIQEVKKYRDIIFISPSNINPEINTNVISMGINLESQLLAISKFIQKKKKTKTVILYPDNQYSSLINSKIKKLNLSYSKLFKYSSDPKVLTGEVEKLTNYSQRKNNLEARKKMLEDKEDYSSQKELERLEQKYTLGKVNFDSVIVIDYGDSLKSILTSLIFTDVNESDVLFTTVNQWFDESLFYENSLETLFYPSVNYKNFENFQKKYFELYNKYPNEISILAYDALGLIYYVWRKNNKITSVKDFVIKKKIKGKIGNFSFKENRVHQELEIYKVEGKKITKF